MDGLPALELWDLIISVFGNISHISDRTGQPVNGKNKCHNKIDVIQDIDSVPSNVQSASQEALLYVFEDNEAVIKMIMKGRSPTMRHVSRTHRVALDWLFDRINLATEAMQWTKEVELVDELRSSSSTRGISMPNFEVLDARIASALNKIIHNSQFKRRISLEEQKAQKEDRFLRGRQIAYLIYDQFRVTGTHDSVENYTDLFTIVLRNDDIQEFDSKWDGILLSMTKIPHDDILEGLYKLRIRESEKLKTVLELYDLETHQKKLGPDYHRLKAMVKRSIEQEIRNKNFGARSANFEKNAVVKNQGTKNSVYKEFLEIVGNGKPTDNA